MKMTADSSVLVSLRGALRATRTVCGRTERPTGSVMDHYFDLARATYELLSPEVKRVAWLQTVERAS